MTKMLRILTFASVGVLFLLLAGIASLVKPVQKPRVTIGLVNFSVEVADEPSEWRKGLVHHEPLSQGEGMLFVFPAPAQKTFWMKDMSFPIDIIWIAKETVVGFVDDARPDNGEGLYYSPGLVDRVMEISAGERKRLGIDIGVPVKVD